MERRQIPLSQRLKMGVLEFATSITLAATLLHPDLAAAQSPPTIAVSQPEFSTLEKYLELIEPQRVAYGQVIFENSPFKTFFPFSIDHPYTTEEQVADFNMYAPIYLAAEMEYGVPWDLLWTMHIQETQVSRLYPGASSYVGAMQRSPRFYSTDETYEAAKNWEILDELPQKNHTSKSPYFTDFREIMWAAKHLTQRSEERYPNLPFLEGILRVVRTGYSTEVFGNQRTDKFLAVHPLFEAANPDTLIATNP